MECARDGQLRSAKTQRFAREGYSSATRKHETSKATLASILLSPPTKPNRKENTMNTPGVTTKPASQGARDLDIVTTTVRQLTAHARRDLRSFAGVDIGPGGGSQQALRLWVSNRREMPLAGRVLKDHSHAAEAAVVKYGYGGKNLTEAQAVLSQMLTGDPRVSLIDIGFSQSGNLQSPHAVRVHARTAEAAAFFRSWLPQHAPNVLTAVIVADYRLESGGTFQPG